MIKQNDSVKLSEKGLSSRIWEMRKWKGTVIGKIGRWVIVKWPEKVILSKLGKVIFQERIWTELPENLEKK